MPTKLKRPLYGQQTEPTRVASPTVPGAVENLLRACDTLTAMAKRRQISEREHQAGVRYRACYDTIFGQLGGSMDFERARGGSLPGKPPPERALEASQMVSFVRRVLYPKDYAVVHRVCVVGQSLEDCAGLFGEGRPAREEAGRRFKIGLSELADRWFPLVKTPMQSFRSECAVVTDVETVERARVHHADS